MEWSRPPINKVYEAMGAIGDKRIEMDGTTAKVYSSSRNKYYDVTYDSKTNVIASNDNASYFVGYLGYPAIAYVLLYGMVPYDAKLPTYLAGFAWKDINKRFKYDFDKTDAYIDEQVVQKHTIDLDEFHATLEQILENIMALELQKPATMKTPPKGY